MYPARAANEVWWLSCSPSNDIHIACSSGMSQTQITKSVFCIDLVGDAMMAPSLTALLEDAILCNIHPSPNEDLDIFDGMGPIFNVQLSFHGQRDNGKSWLVECKENHHHHHWSILPSSSRMDEFVWQVSEEHFMPIWILSRTLATALLSTWHSRVAILFLLGTPLLFRGSCPLKGLVYAEVLLPHPMSFCSRLLNCYFSHYSLFEQ